MTNPRRAAAVASAALAVPLARSVADASDLVHAAHATTEVGEQSTYETPGSGCSSSDGYNSLVTGTIGATALVRTVRSHDMDRPGRLRDDNGLP